MFKSLWNWILRKLKPIFTLAAESILTDALAVLNDPTLQAAAQDAALAAISRGHKGNAAWYAARKHLIATLKATGATLKDSAIDTLLQTAYYCLKNEE